MPPVYFEETDNTSAILLLNSNERLEAELFQGGGIFAIRRGLPVCRPCRIHPCVFGRCPPQAPPSSGRDLSL